MAHDPFAARTRIETPLGERNIYRLDALRDSGDIDRIPYSVKVLLEAVLRNHDGAVIRDQDVRALAAYDASRVEATEIAFKPGRVVLQGAAADLLAHGKGPEPEFPGFIC